MIEFEFNNLQNQHKLRLQESAQERLKNEVVVNQKNYALAVWRRFFRSPKTKPVSI